MNYEKIKIQKIFAFVFIFIFFTFYFVFFGFNLEVSAEIKIEDACKKACVGQLEECYNKCMRGDAAWARNLQRDIQQKQPSQASTNISCDQQYPWCKDEPGNIADLIRKFYNYALAAVGVTALGAIIFGGIKYTVSAGNPSGQSDAIQWITGAVWGLVLLLGANLLLRTINPKLTSLELGKLEDVKIKSYSESLSHEAYEGLRTLGTSVDIKPGASIDGMREQTKGELIILAKEFGGKITLAEGTGGKHESGDYSHAKGYKADVRSLDPITHQPNILTKYIESVPSGWTKITSKDNSNCFTNGCYRSPRGAIYNKEGDHWDILVK